jgi:4-aminobutyrate aminotransferase / (S)-3-amino-2-methylpropionate transaminase / 5-aminovalerate transaminase
MSGFQFSRSNIEWQVINTEFRNICTPIPVPESLEIFRELEEFESRSMHGQMPIVWDRAEGFQVFDAWGNAWIDFTSTIFVTNAGHANQHVVAALKKQLDNPLLHTYTYVSKIRLEYLRTLIDRIPVQFDKAFLLSSGTEATECGLKLMRMRSGKIGKKKPGIIAFEGNWHGRTMGAQMMSYHPNQKDWIGYLDPNIYHLPFPYPWRGDAIRDPKSYFRKNIQKLIKNYHLDPQTDLCGFMLETFQGWGAVFYPPEFVQEVMSFAHEHDMIVTFDEMQSGFGRTGKMFGYMHYEVEPDLLCCGKGAGSGLPLSLVLGSREILDLPEIGSMSSTHSANPLVCAAGLGTLQALKEDNLIEKSQRLGEILHLRLNEIKTRFSNYIKYVLGKGLIAGVIFMDHEGNPLTNICDKICEEALKRGLLLVHTGRESIKIGPPLSISEEALLEGLDVFEECIEITLTSV